MDPRESHLVVKLRSRESSEPPSVKIEELYEEDKDMSKFAFYLFPIEIDEVSDE